MPKSQTSQIDRLRRGSNLSLLIRRAVDTDLHVAQICVNMPPTTIHAAPALDTFTSLADHQSQTPTTFYNAKAVLHFHGTAVRALASFDQISKLPVFAQENNGTSGSVEGERGNKVELVDVYVNSE